MVEKVLEPVSVGLTYDSKKRTTLPRWVVWNGKLYPVLKLGLHHTYKKGTTLFHVFSVVSNVLFFRLVLNTESLNWVLEEVSDGLAN
jgi:hypothetical protein